MSAEFIERTFRNLFEARLHGMISRAEELRGNFQNVKPNYWFSKAVSDSLYMYIHGYYYAVISTSQVYVEALGKLICELNTLVPAKK